MTKDDKFKIGLALNKIAMMLSDEDFHKVKDLLKQIEQIIAEQTENCSEKPNNSTISKMEQVDKDINVRSKTEQMGDAKPIPLSSRITKTEPTTEDCSKVCDECLKIYKDGLPPDCPWK